MHILMSLLVATANANIWKRFCERYLIADDPTQFESVTDDWLGQAIKPLEIRETWGTITPAELHVLGLLRKEASERIVRRGIIARREK